MAVEFMSPKEDMMLDGEYDPVVATGNNAEFLLICDECAEESVGTSFGLADENWEWEIQIDQETIQIKDSKAICARCNEDAEVPVEMKDDEELSPSEKAEQDDMQKSISDIV